jgi:hypothetical protein
MSGSFVYSSAVGQFIIGVSPIEGSGIPIDPGSGGPGSSIGSGADFERLYDNIQTMLPAITLPVIEMELWNTVQEFCIRSTYFRSKIHWEMGPGISTVDFNPFNLDMVVVWVLHVRGLTHWGINPPAVLYDMMPPTNGRSGDALVALRPVRFDVLKLGAIPELFTTWFETMLDGTLARLYAMPAKPWSTPQLAQYHGTRFRQGMGRARDIAERLHSHQQSPRRAFPYFAHGRRKQ